MGEPAADFDVDALLRGYERARRDTGLAGERWRVTPGQHIELMRVLAAMGVDRGTSLPREKWRALADVLAPVVAENREAAELLRKAMDEHGAVEPPTPTPAPEPARKQNRWMLAPLTALLLLWMAALWWLGPGPLREDVLIPPANGPAEKATKTPVVAPPKIPDNARARAAYARASAISIRAAQGADAQRIPLTARTLAAAFAAMYPEVDRDALLAALHRAWPIPADEPLLGKPTSLGDMRRLTAEFAAIESGLPSVYFDDFVSQAANKPSQNEIQAYGKAPTTAVAPPQRWSNDVFYVLFLPALGVLLWGAATYRKEAKRLFDAAGERERRWLQTTDIDPNAYVRETAAPHGEWPKFAFRRETIAKLSRRRPAPGRHIDARRSVKAWIASAGGIDAIYKNTKRGIHYLALLNRRRPFDDAAGESASDHEAVRMRALLGELQRLGMEIYLYEYDDLPLELTKSNAGGGEPRAGQALSLTQLYDLYPNARLLLLTDGREIIDFLRGRVLPQVARPLRMWRERMLLTPAPMGDWGGVERALTHDLDMSIGRASSEAADDFLAHGFGAGADVHRRAFILSRASPDTQERLQRWRAAMSAAAPAAARTLPWMLTESRGDCITFDDPRLLSALPPPPQDRDEIVADLRMWLGHQGFQLCAALAIYPLLRADLTLYMGRHLIVYGASSFAAAIGDDTIGRLLTERLSALPWFRVGFFPDWLRWDLFDAVHPVDLDRAAAVLRGLFKPAKQSRDGGVDIWRPADRLRMAPDDPMRAVVFGPQHGVMTTTPERSAQLREDAKREAVAQRLRPLTLTSVGGYLAYALAPDLAQAPLHAGAWLPLIAYLLICAVAVVVYWRLPKRDAAAAVVAASADKGLRARHAGVSRSEAAAPPKEVQTEAPPEEPTYYVTYSDDDRQLDRLCEEARARGRTVRRIVVDPTNNEALASQVREFLQSDRIFVILDKIFLHSPYRMFELYEIWRRLRDNESALLPRVRLYTHGDINFASPDERMSYAEGWRSEIASETPSSSSAFGERPRWIKQFAPHVDEMYAYFADRVPVRPFEEFLSTGFDNGERRDGKRASDESASDLA